MKNSFAASIVCLFVLASRLDCLGAVKITFLDSGQSDAAVIQIGRTAGEPFTIIVDGGDGDNDLKNNLPALLSQDPTIELVILSHPHRICDVDAGIKCGQLG